MPCSDHRDTITESGGTEMGVGAVSNGQYLRRVGDEVIGATIAASSEATGSVKMWAGPAAGAPAGWLVCQGTFVPQVTYPTLFALLGHAFNAGVDPLDGTFKLPDLRDAFPRGANTEPDRGLTGGATTHTHTVVGNQGHTPGGTPTVGPQVTSAASSLPPYQYLHFIIKT